MNASAAVAPMKYRELAVAHADDLLFGYAPKPLTTRHGMRIGGGVVYPELNFTLPPMEVTEATMPAVTRHYRDIIADALRRAVELEAPGVVIEFETVPPMTAQLEDLPSDEGDFIDRQMALADASKYLPAEYGL